MALEYFKKHISLKYMIEVDFQKQKDTCKCYIIA